jgi:hypothetical protein
MSWAICPTRPARPSRVSGGVEADGAPKEAGVADAGGTVVEAGGMVEVIGGPDIFDTRLIGTLVLPGLDRRLYE